MAGGVLKRTVRYAGLARDLLAEKRAGDSIVRDNARRHLAARMGKLRGLPQKVGQIMSMSSDDPANDALATLNDQAEPLSFDVIQPILEEAWGKPLSDVVGEIDTRGRAASLGQVHRATLATGQSVAIKVAYPGIREAVMGDLKMLGWLSVPLGDLRRGFDLGAYRREIVRDLEEELDYRTELAHQTQHARAAVGVAGLVVPAVVPEWSTQNVLMTAWTPGQTIDEAARWPQRQRQQLARLMLDQFLTFVFERGLIHADPNPGNYRFRNEPRSGPSVVLYDYGSVTRLSERDRLLLLRLIGDTAARRGDPIGPLTELGFSATLLEPIRAKLPAVCSVLFEPFAQVGKFDLSQWRRAERLDDILGDDRWNFRMAGPANLILLMRAFRGLLYYLERLGEPVSWGLAIRPILARFAGATERLALPCMSDKKGSFESMAAHLRIEVHENSAKKVSLTMPIAAIEDLDQILDPDVGARIAARGVSLPTIVRNVRRSGYVPAELFTLDEPTTRRTIRVWIE